MYLTRMYLNSNRRGAQKLLGSPQAMHAAVLSAFPPETPHTTEAGRVLWRVDTYPHRTALLLVSPHEPDLTSLVEQAGWQTGEMWQTRPYGVLLDRIEPQQRWSFRLRANPTYAGRKDGWSDTKPRAHTTVDQQTTWLLRRCAAAGFEIPVKPSGDRAFEIVERASARFRRGSGKPVCIGTATYQGELVVADSDALRNTLTHGIGRAKAYGCGLMTLAPIALP